uniref:Uncharacterized protein n=1 Tax=Rhizophora mucronata TaxID=61149 RepID=A0A2P2MXI5_RHIMU
MLTCIPMIIPLSSCLHLRAIAMKCTIIPKVFLICMRKYGILVVTAKLKCMILLLLILRYVWNWNIATVITHIFLRMELMIINLFLKAVL